MGGAGVLALADLPYITRTPPLLALCSLLPTHRSVFAHLVPPSHLLPSSVPVPSLPHPQGILLRHIKKCWGERAAMPSPSPSSSSSPLLPVLRLSTSGTYSSLRDPYGRKPYHQTVYHDAAGRCVIQSRRRQRHPLLHPREKSMPQFDHGQDFILFENDPPLELVQSDRQRPLFEFSEPKQPLSLDTAKSPSTTPSLYYEEDCGSSCSSPSSMTSTPSGMHISPPPAEDGFHLTFAKPAPKRKPIIVITQPKQISSRGICFEDEKCVRSVLPSTPVPQRLSTPEFLDSRFCDCCDEDPVFEKQGPAEARCRSRR